MDDPFAGRLINNKYRVVAPIGQGGMGKIYRAEQLPLGRVVALKVLRQTDAMVQNDPAFQRRFFLEASLCAKLSHPNIVTVHDYGRIEGIEGEAYFLAMEYLEGVTLHQRLRSRAGPLSVEETIAIVLGIARGLREAHRHGVVHRDLKPGNVMLVPDPEAGERVKILDFGLVKQVEGADREDLTRENSFLGSPKYMSPEQIEHGAVDHRTDLYSLGVIMYQCLTGRVPFDAPTTMKILVAHVTQPVPPMREVNPTCEVPPALEDLVCRLLAKRPEERIASADELVRTLREMYPRLVEQGTLPPQLRPGVAPPAGVRASDAEGDATGTLGGASISGVRPDSRSLPRARRAFVLPLVIGAGVLFLVIGAGVLLHGRRGGAPAAAAASGQDVSQPLRASASLHIESIPPGAVVSENGRALGMTPLDIALPSGERSLRRFVLTLAGHRSAMLEHMPDGRDARLQATLAPEPAPLPPAPVTTVEPAPPTRPAGLVRAANRARSRPAITHSPSVSSPAQRPELDIRMER